MDLVPTPEIELVAASNASSEFASFATETPHPYAAGPGDDDEDDDDPATGGGGGGNIDPDDDDYADEEDEDDDDEDPLWAAPGYRGISMFAAPQHSVL
jgi:hypothetical protein